MYQEIVNEYDNWFSQNYKTLVAKVNYLYQSRLDENQQLEVLHETYIKIKSRIEISGLTGGTSGFMAFTFRSLRYQMMQDYNNKKTNKKYQFQSLEYTNIDIDNNCSFTSEVLERLDEIEYFNSSQGFYDQLEILTKLLFEYIESHYSEKQSFIWKSYYLTSNNTYKKLSITTGYEFKTIKNSLSIMKKDIRTNFIKWVEEKNKHQHE